MTRTAFLFPGQGSQRPGMVAPFAEAWPVTADAVECLADNGLRDLLFDADEATLREPANAQRAVVATGLAVERGVRDRTGIDPALVAGHSLGHVTAAAVAGAIPPREAVALVAERGRLMAMADAEAGPGTMVAVTLATPETVEEVVGTYESVAIGAYNGPDQTVISGPAAAVRAAAADVERVADRARTTELDVATAFHSPVMEPAVEPFRAALAATPLADPAVPLVSDVTGEVYDDAATLERHLRDQLVSPVRWDEVCETLVARGIERSVVLPPAGTLAALTGRRTEGDVVALESPADAAELSP